MFLYFISYATRISTLRDDCRWESGAVTDTDAKAYIENSLEACEYEEEEKGDLSRSVESTSSRSLDRSDAASKGQGLLMSTWLPPRYRH